MPKLQETIFNFPEIGLFFDFSKSELNSEFVCNNKALIDRALLALKDLEAGAISNPTEQRMVGHYWLRAPELAPPGKFSDEILAARNSINNLVGQIDRGQIKSEKGTVFNKILLIGIGGSALGPQFIAKVFAGQSKRKIFFFDNTDPDGFEQVFKDIGALEDLLCIVISKSGSTPETVNGQVAAENKFKQAGLQFSKSAIAITQSGSKLDKYAEKNQWIARLPMWDWVGGRTSIWSAVGLLPLQLLNIDTNKFLAGAAQADLLGRSAELCHNPAMLLALCWLRETAARGEKNMVILPYSDRLELFGKYLQQLIMESLGKEHDLQGKVVNQGISVFGNKGSTDQHSYIQQLRSGLNDFFAIFINTLKSEHDISVAENETAADYLNGFFLGSRRALKDNARSSLTVTINQIDEFSVGALIAIFERAVSIYASFVNINAYDQPGVEAGKKAATEFLKIKAEIFEQIKSASEKLSLESICCKHNSIDNADVLQLLLHLEAAGRIKSDQQTDYSQRRFWA